MPIRYHAQRKHIIYSLDALLYELHTLSFLLSPSIFVLLCRCITQFQFARVRELDGRRSLLFWLGLVALVNVSAVWSHAFGEGEGGGKGVVLDFVGMGHRATRAQLLLLDATIIFLQTVLSTISYETSLALAMPDVADPLLPPSLSSSSSSNNNNDDEFSEEVAPFLPYTSPEPDADTSSLATATASTSFTYPPSPPSLSVPAPIPVPFAEPSTSSSIGQEQDSQDVQDLQIPSSKPSPPTPLDPLPPSHPIISLTFTHILHRLSSPVPEPPARASEALDEGDDELAVLRLPLPNTTSVRVAQTFRILAQARQRQRQRDQQMARRLRRRDGSDGNGSGARDGAGSGAGNGSGSGTEGRGQGRGQGRGPGRGRRRDGSDNAINGSGSRDADAEPRGGRIPGAISDEDEG